MLRYAAGRRQASARLAQARWTSSSASSSSRAALGIAPHLARPTGRHDAASAPTTTTTPMTRHDTVPPHVRTHASVAGPAVESIPWHVQDNLPASQPTFTWNYPSADAPLLKLPPVEAPPARRSVLGHTTEDLLQHLLAAVRVNRFDRASSIIKRLQSTEETTEAEYVYACEIYLDAFSRHMRDAAGPATTITTLESWFNKRGLAHKQGNSKACLYMMRAALSHHNPAKRDERVRAYAELSSMTSEAILASSLWTDREYLVIGAILHERPVPNDIELPVSKDEPSSTVRDESVDETPLKHDFPLQPEDIPQILQVEQRGLGLKLLKQVLGLQEEDKLRNKSAEPLDKEAQVLRDLERERLIENAAKDAAVAKWKAEAESLRAVGINSALSSKKINALMWQWYSDLVPILREELSHMKQRLDSYDKDGKQASREVVDTYAIYLDSVTPEKLAVVTLIHMISHCFAGKDLITEEYPEYYKVADAAKSLGEHVETEIVAQGLNKERTSKWYLKQMREGNNPSSASTTDSLLTAVRWPTSAKVQIGAMLISKFLDTVKMAVTRQHPRTKEYITKIRPAFVHRNVFAKGKRVAVLAPCSDLRSMLSKEPPGALISKKLPMVVEPVPWSGFRTGGYLSHPDNFVRMPIGDDTPREYAKAAIEKGHLDQVFNAITALGKTPWRINQQVLRVQIEAWNRGEAIADFPPLEPNLQYPPEPPVTSDPHARAKWARDVRVLDNKVKGWHSQRCHQNLQLEIARSFKDDTIYFPHNVDFRGRAYPLPPYLNHMGADNVRALMLFAKGKELGPNGLRWLKIQLSNVFGYDKDSFAGREAFIDKHLDDIYDSVRNPLDGRRWWLKSDDAWQTLAACFELTNALDSPDPEKYMSCLPIQQDGTCNGLQHYAALGGDPVGARQVNLEPGDKPSDVYTAVAEGVINKIKQDLATGNPLAKFLDGKITRRVVKQPVMTNVYGVTYFGARAQVQKQLEDIFPHIRRSDTPNHMQLASYITHKIFSSLGEMFTGAQAIQAWLGTCADRISTCITPEQIEAIKSEGLKAQEEADVHWHPTKIAPKRVTKFSARNIKANFKTTVVWTTPLQFPVVQPYRDSTARPLSTALSCITISEPRGWDPVSKRKQMQAFPPNFIHSLDATHMMLSAAKCDEKGITFASIHDSFWTHAADREELSELLRDAFVHMHREDIIGRLREEFIARYKGCMWRTSFYCPRKLADQFQEIRRSAAFHALLDKYAPGSNLPDGEIVVEGERHRLLNSSDPEEQKLGQAMVTPASLYAQEGDNIFENSGLGDTALGAEPAEEPDLLSETRSGEEEDEEFLAHKAEKSAEASESARLAKMTSRHKQFIWQPLVFPETPEKGTFDVRRLKQSKYFFH